MYKRIIYISFLILLLLPISQYYFNFIEVGKLDGAFTLQSEPKFTFKSWFDGDFQEKYDRHLEDSIGFRNYMIRAYNQFNYSLFNVAKSPGCVVGKDKQLYLRSYIEGYLGLNFKGEEKIDDEISKLKRIQDALSDQGKTLLLVFAPGKASFCPEYISDEYDVNSKTTSNYDYYIKKCKELQVNLIDLNQYFKDIKTTSKYPLYPQNGVHWSHYGMYLGIDSIVKYIEKKRNINISDIIVDEINMSDSVVHPDFDVEANMNLMFEINKPAMPYLKFSYNENESSIKPKVLTISDSYYWQIYGANIPHNIFQFGGFWFYFKTIYPERNGVAVKVDDINLKEELLSQDVIILMGTEATLHLFPYDFIDKSYEFFIENNGESLVEYYINKIKKDTDWYDSIVEKAKANNISVDEQLKLDAEFMAGQESTKKENSVDEKEKRIEEIIINIKSDLEWFHHVKQKAIEQNIDIDTMLRRDAIWVYENPS